MRLNRSRTRGVTLIELMIAVAIMFILGAFAIPAYRDYIKTSRMEVMMGKVEQFRAFQENYRIDNGTYAAGTYDPAGTNDFLATLGYRVPGDHDGISFTVTAGACGDLAACYRVVVVSNAENIQGTYESENGGTWTWVEP